MGAASLFGRAGAAAAVLAACILAGAAPARALEPRVEARVARLPLYFVENRGQAPPSVAYTLPGRDKTLFFTARGVTFLLDAPGAGRYALRLDFPGANRHVRPRGEARTPAVVSYFKGHPTRWRTGIPTYSRLVYEDLWPGIDLVFTGTVERMKYSFLVRPGADPRRIRLRYRGATRLAVNARGELAVATPAGVFHDAAPVSFQAAGGRQVEIPTAYALDAATGSYGFRLGAYDRRLPLLVDPEVFLYAGFIGGSSDDRALGVAVDAAGNAYVVGFTGSTETTFPDGDGFGPLPGFDQTLNPTGDDAFVVKVNAAGTALVYASFLGGAGSDTAFAVAVDADGNAYVTGSTDASQATFPVILGPDTTFNGDVDAFVTKVNAAGTALLYSGYIGGGDVEVAHGIAVDAAGNAYVTGNTRSSETTFPDGDGIGALPGPDTTWNGLNEGFVVKVNSAGTGFLYAGYIGGAGGSDVGLAIAVDPAGNAYVGGITDSSEATFPDGDGFGAVSGPDSTFNGESDGFVAKVNAAGTGLVYAGYIGGVTGDGVRGIVVDGLGNAYIAGLAGSTQATFPDGDGFGALPGPDTTHNGLFDAFVAKVDAGGTALVYAGYIGGAGLDQGFAIALDAAGQAYVAGETDSTEATFPDGDGFGGLSGPDGTFNGGFTDGFVAKVDAAGSAFLYAGYVGGALIDSARAIAVDTAQNAYVAGFAIGSTETTFPDGDGMGELPSFDRTSNGGGDAFLVKIGLEGDVVVPPIPGLRPQGILALVLLLSAAGLFALRRAV